MQRLIMLQICLKNYEKWLLFTLVIIFSQSIFANWSTTEFQNNKIHNFLPNNKQKKALMINLPGCLQKNNNLKDYGNWEKAALRHNMIVSVPAVYNGGIFIGCWDFIGKSQKLSRPHVQYVVNWIEHLMSQKKLNIDPRRVYISGHSSGGAMSMLVSCLRPDLIAGIGVSGGPALGRSVFGTGNKTNEEVGEKLARLCKKWSADYSPYLKSQIVSFIYGSKDRIIDNKVADINILMYKNLSTTKLAENKLSLHKLRGYNTNGTLNVWEDRYGRKLSKIINTDLRHFWPGGQGDQRYRQVEGNSVNYAYYLANFLEFNNRRVP